MIKTIQKKWNTIQSHLSVVFESIKSEQSNTVVSYGGTKDVKQDN
jgi:hypothetical protein